MKTKYRHPLIKIPTDIQFTLYLIKEELKSRRLFDTLSQVGFDDSYFQPRLDSLILRSLGMDDDSHKTFDTYYEIMERRSKKINADHDTITRQALKAYHELLQAKKRLSASEV